MYLAIDIGASKTLLAVFSADGRPLYKKKIATEPTYKKFLAGLKTAVEEPKNSYQLRYCCCAAPGLIDRQRGVVRYLGNLNWLNVPLKDDVSRLLDGIPTVVENDAKLAGLSEAQSTHKRYRLVLYLTLSTGIGDAIIIDGKIEPALADSEVGHMVMEHKGKLVKWEDLASGRALKQRYGKLASEIDDPKIWQQYSYLVALGLNELIATLQPDIVIIGGGVGTHFEKFGKLLVRELKKFENQMVKMPPIQKAKRPEEAVIYGCYQFARQQG